MKKTGLVVKTTVQQMANDGNEQKCEFDKAETRVVCRNDQTTNEDSDQIRVASAAAGR